MVALGTPYFNARDVPCEMCDDIPCVKACPTGALDPALKDINKARMGLCRGGGPGGVCRVPGPAL